MRGAIPTGFRSKRSWHVGACNLCMAARLRRLALCYAWVQVVLHARARLLSGKLHLQPCQLGLTLSHASVTLPVTLLTVSCRAEGLAEKIDEGEIGAQEDVKVRGKKLTDEFGWDKDLTKKIWCFGPDTMGPNMLLDATKAVQYLSEIKDSCVGAFQWASKEGVMAEEVLFLPLSLHSLSKQLSLDELCMRHVLCAYVLNARHLHSTSFAPSSPECSKTTRARCRHVSTSRLIHAGHARLRL